MVHLMVENNTFCVAIKSWRVHFEIYVEWCPFPGHLVRKYKRKERNIITIMRKIMGGRNDEEEHTLVTMWEDSCPPQRRTSFIGNINSDISMSPDMTMKGDKSSLSPYLGEKRRQYSLRNLTVLCLAAIFCAETVGGDMVYVRSGDFGQLVTSSTARWSKGTAKDPLMLKKPNEGQDDAWQASWSKGN